MATLQWDEIKIVHVGDSAPDMWFFVPGADGVTPENLTGWAAAVSFWYADADSPHVVRQALVDNVNSLIKYQLQGDEFPTVGEVYFQWTGIPPAEAALASRGFFKMSGPVMRRTVLA